MAATKKSAKRSAGKRSSKAKGSSTRKKSSGKASAKRRAGKSTAKATTLKRSRKPRAARGGLETVRQVGEKTWETLKTTTAQVVEGVKETFGG